MNYDNEDSRHQLLESLQRFIYWAHSSNWIANGH